MPLPNYGYYNKEKKENQQLKFQMAPEIVDDPEDSFLASGRKESRKKGRVTTGKADTIYLFLFFCIIYFCF